MTQAEFLDRTSPEAQGIPSAAILAFLDAADEQIHDLHSIMLLRHAAVVAAGWWTPYGPSDPHMLFSLSKSFTSTAVGLAIEEGRLSLDDPVLGFFPDDAPLSVGEHLAAMRVRHLLSMSTGHAEDTLNSLRQMEGSTWVRAFLGQPVAYAPGTHFVYNSGASYMLSAIVQGLSGQRLVEYLQPRLFEPLGIAHATWETSPEGIDVGGWGLNITTTDIARFGQLYLQKGLWHGRRILPEAWVAEATACQVPNGPHANPDWEQGYGYQVWRCRHGAYRGDGAFGQFCVVMPEQDAVLAITAGVANMQAVLALVWEHLLPAMGASPLPVDSTGQAALEDRLARLSLPVPQGAASSPDAARVSGKRFVFEPNEEQIAAIACDVGREADLLTLEDDRGPHQVECGHGSWRKGSTTLERPEPRHVAASGAWTDEHTYTMKLYFYETPFAQTIVCRFDGDRVVLERSMNVSFGPTERPRLEGRAA